MVDTFRESKKQRFMEITGKVVESKLMTSLFPNGVVLKTEEDYNIWHPFELLVVKITSVCQQVNRSIKTQFTTLQVYAERLRE